MISQGWIDGPSEEEEIKNDNIYNKVIRGDKNVLEQVAQMSIESTVAKHPTEENKQLLQRVKENYTRKHGHDCSLENKPKKKVIFVNKGGMVEKKKINEEENAAKKDEILEVLRKENCLDIFRDAFLLLNTKE